MMLTIFTLQTYLPLKWVQVSIFEKLTNETSSVFLRKMVTVENLAIVFAAAVVLVTKSSIGEVRREFGLVV